MVVEDPWDFADFVKACAGIYSKHWQMEIECASESARQSDAPHADDQAIYVEQGISACIENAVYDNCADCSPDHIDRQNHEHSAHIVFCGVAQHYEMLCEWNRGKNDDCAAQAHCKRQNQQAVADSFARLKFSSAQFISDDDLEGNASVVNVQWISTQLETLCEDKKLYLQHDLTLQQLALIIGTNRTYLGTYFAQQGITYNTYINLLRIKHFTQLYRESIASKLPSTAQQLALDSGFRRYATFSNAFKKYTGTTVSAWIRDLAQGKAADLL